MARKTSLADALPRRPPGTAISPDATTLSETGSRARRVLPVDLASIEVPPRLRTVDPETVSALANSIARLGLQSPIVLQKHPDDPGLLLLVAGAHRLQAVRELGWPRIESLVVEPRHKAIPSLASEGPRAVTTRPSEPQPPPVVPSAYAAGRAVAARVDPAMTDLYIRPGGLPGGRRTGLAWMATAGVAVALDERAILDLAWRYTDLGEARTPRGPGRVVWRDGSREPLSVDLAPTRARLAGHGIRLSLRHAF